MTSEFLNKKKKQIQLTTALEVRSQQCHKVYSIYLQESVQRYNTEGWYMFTILPNQSEGNSLSVPLIHVTGDDRSCRSESPNRAHADGGTQTIVSDEQSP